MENNPPKQEGKAGTVSGSTQGLEDNAVTIPAIGPQIPAVLFSARQFWIALSTIIGLAVTCLSALFLTYNKIVVDQEKIKSAVITLERTQEITNTTVHDKLQDFDKRIDRLEDSFFKSR